MKKEILILFCLSFILVLIGFISAIGEYDLGGRKVVCGERYNCSSGEQVDYCYLNITQTPEQTILKCDCDLNPEKFCPQKEKLNIFEKLWNLIKALFD